MMDFRLSSSLDVEVVEEGSNSPAGFAWCCHSASAMAVSTQVGGGTGLESIPLLLPSAPTVPDINSNSHSLL